MSRRRRRWYWIPALAFLGLMTFNVQRLLRAEPPTRPRAGDVAAATRISPPPTGTTDERQPPPPDGTVSGPGVVEPAAPETRVGVAVAGTIATIAVREGERVEAGAVIAELTSTIEQAQLEAAEADVEAARAQLDRAVRGSRGDDVRAAIADAEAATARAELSRGVASRVATAAQAGGATADELDRAQRQAEADASAARAADARRAAVLAGSRREDIRLARAQLVAAEARRDQARGARERLIVRAPIAGEILQLKFRAGEYYQPGSEPLAVLGDTSRLTVRMDVDERDVGRVALGAAVTVRANAFPGRELAGHVVELGRRMGRKNVRTDEPAERNDTKILEVVISIDDPSGLVVGQRVTCYVTAPAVARAP